MSVEFKEKENQQKDSAIVEELSNFLFSHSAYLDGTFSLVNRKNIPIGKEELDNLLRYRKKEIVAIDGVERKSLDEYISLMCDFYDCEIDELGYRRGQLLEKLICKKGPLKKAENYNMFKEALIFNNKLPISSRDIDIVFLFSDVELHECKSCLKNVIREPIKYKDREKLELLCNTKKLIHSEKKQCDAYVATYTFDSNGKIQNILDKYGFNSISIFTGRDIIKYLKN